MNVIENVIHNDKKSEYLWKYVDLHRFLYFIQEKKIYFTRLDLFEDPHEGLPDTLIFQRFMNDNSPEEENLNTDVIPKEDKIRWIKQQYRANEELEGYSKYHQQKQYASCWFMGDRESVAMWKLYSNPDSVAITINRVELEKRMSLYTEKCNDKCIEKFIFGCVEYRPVYPPELNRHEYCPTNQWAAYKKDISYKHEQEYRFVIVTEQLDETKVGYEFPIRNFKYLDFKIRPHPQMQDWKVKNIKRMMRMMKCEDKFVESTIKLR